MIDVKVVACASSVVIYFLHVEGEQKVCHDDRSMSSSTKVNAKGQYQVFRYV